MRKRTILVLSPLPAALVEALFRAASHGEGVEEAQAVSYEGESRDDLLAAVKAADVIIGDYTFNIEMDAEVVEAAVPCLLIQQPSTGYQHIDVEAAARAGIPVANVAGANAIAVAEHTVMMILGCLKRLTLCHELTLKGEWAQDEMATKYGGVFELSAKTLGIIGMGRIGREVAARAMPFGCAMVYYDPLRLSPEDEQARGVSFRDLDDLVSESDVVTGHVPMTPETRNMFDAERIARMKPNAVFINVSRGGLADEAALAAALAEGRLMGAGLDVFSSEPIEAGNPLLKAPNTILTPHTAGATNESRLRIIGVALENVAAVLSGERPEYVVNGVR